MKKQGFLPGIPTTLFGSLKRSEQARIQAQLAEAVARGCSSLSVIFAAALPALFLGRICTSSRRRTYHHSCLFWTWLHQILSGNESCRFAVAQLRAWRSEAKLPVPSTSTSSYCQARANLPIGFLEAILARTAKALARVSLPTPQVIGNLRLKAIDGSSVQLLDTAENQTAFPRPCGQKAGCGFPVMGLVAVADLESQSWVDARIHPYRNHDLQGAFALLSAFKEGDLVLADRAFSSYEFIASLLGQGAHSLMRLHQARHAALDWRQGKKLDSYQRLVTWTRPKYRPTSKLTEAQWQALPEQITVRLIKLLASNREGKIEEMVLVTTLIDDRQYHGIELFDVYLQRWEIEHRLREVKTTLGLEKVRSNTPDMAHKTLLMGLIASNLLRHLMAQAAQQRQAPATRISFQGARVAVLAHQGRLLGTHPSHKTSQKIITEIIQSLIEDPLPERPGRQQPRALKTRPKPYSYLTKHRSIFQPLPHRGKRDKAA